MCHDIEAVCVEQRTILGPIEASVVQWFNFEATDGPPCEGPLVNIRTALGAECSRNTGKTPR